MPDTFFWQGLGVLDTGNRPLEHSSIEVCGKVSKQYFESMSSFVRFMVRLQFARGCRGPIMLPYILKVSVLNAQGTGGFSPSAPL